MALLALFAIGRFAVMRHQMTASVQAAAWVASIGSAQRLGGDVVVAAANAVALADGAQRGAWGDSLRLRAVRFQEAGNALGHDPALPAVARRSVTLAAREGMEVALVVRTLLARLDRGDLAAARPSALAIQQAMGAYDRQLAAALDALEEAQTAQGTHLDRLALVFLFATLLVLALLALRVVLPTIGASRALFHAVVDAQQLTEGVIQGAHDAIFAFDRARRVTLWNPAMERLHRRRRVEVLGKSLPESFPGYAADGLETIFDRVLSGETVVVRHQEVAPAADGDIIIVDATYHPLRNASGDVTGGVGIVRDITEERASARQVERLSAIVEQTQEGVVMTDAAGHLTWVNPAWERITGWTLGDVVGRQPGELLGGSGTDRATSEAIGRAVTSGNAISGELLNYRRDGTPFWMSFHITPMRDAAGVVTSFLAIHHDVSNARAQERALRGERAFAASLVAANSDGVVAVDQTFRITEWNPTIERWSAIPRAVALGDTLDAILPIDDPGARQLRFERLFATGEPFTQERLYRFDSSSTVIVAETVVSAIRDLKTGEITGALCTVRDLTERHAAAESLRASEERSRTIVQYAANVIVGVRPDHTIFEWNGAAEQLFGVTRARALGEDYVTRFLPAESRAAAEAELRKVLGGEATRDFDAPAVRADGTRASLRWNVSRIVDGDGMATGAIAIGDDLTERIEAEAAVRRERERLADAISSLDSGFAMFDAGERLVAFNPRFAAFWPDGGAPALGTPLRVLVEGLAGARRHRSPGESADWIARTLARLRGDGESFEERVGRSAQRVSIARTRDGGSVVLFTDISSLKAIQASLEQARDAANAASRAKSAFLASMSHELRTPLNSIIGFSQQVLKNRHGGLHQKDQLFLERVARNGMHLLSLINRILDLSKIEAGRFAMHPASTDIGALVRETVLLLEGELVPVGGSAPELRVIIPASLLPLETDGEQLRQVLINLVSNALRFTPEGSVTVAVEADATHRPTAVVVRDTGIGIPSERLDAIFEPFEQATVTTARDYGGTGLGLAISRSICTLLGATLEVTSTVGAGSEFRIQLSPVSGAVTVGA